MTLRKITIQEGTNIEYSSKELLFLAKSGQPYRGTIYINFSSKGETFNLLDFKKYITSLRSVTLNAENIAYTIYKKIENSISSNNLGVVVDLTARGGIQQRICFGESFVPVLKENIFQV
jgi:NADPH-dependent 7-cyano-7-deazaguanine reductase QueF